jgi:hypothetical protein
MVREYYNVLGRDNNKQKQTLWSKSSRELYRPSGRRLSSKLVLTFADIGVSFSEHGG